MLWITVHTKKISFVFVLFSSVYFNKQKGVDMLMLHVCMQIVKVYGKAFLQGSLSYFQ